MNGYSFLSRPRMPFATPALAALLLIGPAFGGSTVARAQTSGNGGLLGRIKTDGDKGTTSAKGGTAKTAKTVVAKPDAPKPAPMVEAKPEVVVATEPVVPATLLVSAEGYTGILIDARDFDVQRTPSPVVYGPEEASETLYPDIRYVPTPDEVQDASVIRYYYDEATARKGYVGSNPLIIKAVTICGPGRDCVRLSADDAAKIKALDKEIHFTQSWRVGILLPAGR